MIQLQLQHLNDAIRECFTKHPAIIPIKEQFRLNLAPDHLCPISALYICQPICPKQERVEWAAMRYGLSRQQMEAWIAGWDGLVIPLHGDEVQPYLFGQALAQEYFSFPNSEKEEVFVA